MYPGFTAVMEPSIVLPMNYDPNDNDNDNGDDDIDHGPSKSELKRHSQGLQDLGEQLIGLPQVEFEAMDMPDTLRDAVALARRITAHGGLYRQKQYIGKLMRNLDSEPIRKALEARNLRQRSATLRLRKVEAWRAKLLDPGAAGLNGVLDELLAECPGIDRKGVTRLVAQALRERERGLPPRASRELFAALRDVGAE